MSSEISWVGRKKSSMNHTPKYQTRSGLHRAIGPRGRSLGWSNIFKIQHDMRDIYGPKSTWETSMDELKQISSLAEFCVIYLSYVVRIQLEIQISEEKKYRFIRI
jgi:hypothetical protein